MSNIVNLDLNLDQDYIKASVENVVKGAIIQALGEPERLVANAINMVVDSYVDEDGKPVKKDSYRAKPYLQWLAEHTIKKTVRECIKEEVEKRSAEFRAEVTKQISTKKFKDDVFGAFVETVLKEADGNFKMPITLTFEKPRDY